MEEETENILKNDVESFTRDFQARYLIKLRSGGGELSSARKIGFEPRIITEYRHSNPIFEEEVQEAMQEAEEEVQAEMRQAALRGEPHALRAFASRWGWTDKKEVSAGNINVFNGVELTGNPIERLLRAQEQIVQRPAIEEGPKIIDVSVDEVE